MGRTKIFIPSSGDIDMYDDVSTPLNFSIADIRKPDKRNSNYSKTIKVPNTKNNALLFGNIFDVNITNGTFNPNAKVRASLIIDDEEQIGGYLQMLNIIINDNNKIEYELTIIGNVGSIFGAIGNAELTDLDFTEFDHTYDYATQVASYTNDYNDGYCYPLIDYGFDADLTKVDVEHLFPSIFLRQYIDKIFAGVGYTFESTFFDSTFFKKLIVPTNAGKVILTDAQIAPRLFEATQTVQSSGDIASTLAIDVIFDNEVSDVGSQYNPVTGEWTVANSGYYNLAGNGSVVVTAAPTPSAGQLAEFFRIEVKPIATGFYNMVAETYTPTIINGTHTSYVGISNIFLNAGDKVKCTLRYAQLSGSFTGGFTINGGTFKNAVVNSGLIEGDTITVNQVVPSKIKQKDLFMSIVNAFNLYIDVDKDNDKNLIIETRDDFYSSGTNEDWSFKLDDSKPVEYKPMGDLDYKEFLFNYTDDTDYFNKKYKDTYLETYGRYRYVTDNEFLSGVSETKIIFSPTPLVGDNASDRVISRIWDVDTANNVKSKAFNIRLLYNGGAKTSNVAFEHNGRTSGVHSTTQYLYAGHVDNPVSPTLDLSFGVPQEIYYNTSYYTNNNLFNAYHKKFIDEITDRDSKIVTAYFYLKPSDIRTLDFRNQFFFNNEYFRLNKIYDFDPLKHDVTKCEFIKIKDAGTFTRTLHSLLGGLSSAIGTEFAPVLTGSNYDVKDNVLQSGSARAMQGGEDNILDDSLRGAIIQGNSNTIGNSEGVALIGSSSGNIVGSGLEGVVLINTHDQEINSSGTYINGNLVTDSLFNTPRAMLSDSTNQSVASVLVGQAITINTNESIYNMTHSTVTNTSRIYVDVAGTYVIHAEVEAETTSANTEAYFWLRVNGSDVARSGHNIELVNANDKKSVTMVYHYTFTAGQYFEIMLGGNSTNVRIAATNAVVAPSTPVRPASPSIFITAHMI